MSVYGKPALVSAAFLLLSFPALVRGEEEIGYLLFAASMLMLATSFVCEAIEKRSTRSG